MILIVILIVININWPDRLQQPLPLPKEDVESQKRLPPCWKLWQPYLFPLALCSLSCMF
jgi:hypothetical protein